VNNDVDDKDDIVNGNDEIHLNEINSKTTRRKSIKNSEQVDITAKRQLSSSSHMNDKIIKSVTFENSSGSLNSSKSTQIIINLNTNPNNKNVIEVNDISLSDNRDNGGINSRSSSKKSFSQKSSVSSYIDDNSSSIHENESISHHNNLNNNDNSLLSPYKSLRSLNHSLRRKSTEGNYEKVFLPN
jgi:hypothetical protein